MGPPGGMGPGMGMPQTPMPRPPVVRQGTSKAVPVVVSAGLAVGVFCGLLFGLGTGDKDVQAAPSTGTNAVAKTGDPDSPPPPPETKIDQSMVGLANKVDPAAGSGSGSAAGSGSAQPTIPEAPVKPKLTVELSPPEVAATAKITVDGKPLEGMIYEVDLAGADKKEVRVVVKAKDYKEIEQKVVVDNDMTLKLELLKRPSRGKYTPPRTGGSSGGTVKKKPDNQIDI